VTIKKMLSTLLWAIENPATGIRVIDVPRIRAISRASS